MQSFVIAKDCFDSCFLVNFKGYGYLNVNSRIHTNFMKHLYDSSCQSLCSFWDWYPNVVELNVLFGEKLLLSVGATKLIIPTTCAAAYFLLPVRFASLRAKANTVLPFSCKSSGI
ncbi:hypothetical protein VNO77_22210 [Canavalia gladiata]|uniref:Uncharacterized protein n=1 Tax=Canavalia gladiata TaxID=3824 RepID=A0AAN9QAU0_CANGL